MVGAHWKGFLFRDAVSLQSLTQSGELWALPPLTTIQRSTPAPGLGSDMLYRLKTVIENRLQSNVLGRCVVPPFLLLVTDLPGRVQVCLPLSPFSPRRKQQGVSQSLASFVLGEFFLIFDVLEHDGGIFQSLEEAF